MRNRRGVGIFKIRLAVAQKQQHMAHILLSYEIGRVMKTRCELGAEMEAVEAVAEVNSLEICRMGFIWCIEAIYLFDDSSGQGLRRRLGDECRYNNRQFIVKYMYTSCRWCIQYIVISLLHALTRSGLRPIVVVLFSLCSFVFVQRQRITLEIIFISIKNVNSFSHK